MKGQGGPRTARDLAREVLTKVEREQAYATPALAAALDRSSLAPNDRGLVTELVYGVLRSRMRLDRALAGYATKGLPRGNEVMDALRLAAYQILMLRIPAHAAVDDAVAAVKGLRGPAVAGFANALLRKLVAAGEPPLPSDPLERLSVEHSLPRWILDSVAAALGPDHAELGAAAAALSAPAALSLRATGRTTRDALMAQLLAERPDAKLAASPIIPEAILARDLPSPFATSAATRGLLVAEDLGAQAVVRLLGPLPGQRILDACAGRGGKSLHLADLAPGARIDSADLSARKLEALVETAKLTGATGLTPITLDLTDAAAAAARLAPAYDAVLLDAPCSGLGVLRRHPEAKWRRTPADPPRLAELAARILDVVAPRVAPGGLLVFAVCSFAPEETTAQLRRLAERHPDLVPESPPPAPGVELAALAVGPGIIRTWPHRHDADGFFAVRLRRKV